MRASHHEHETRRTPTSAPRALTRRPRPITPRVPDGDRLAERIADLVSERRTADTVELSHALRRIEHEIGQLKDRLANTDTTVGSLQRDLGTLQIAVGATAARAQAAVSAATDQVKGVAADVGASVADVLTERNYLVPREWFTWRNFWANFIKRWKSLATITGLFYGAWQWGVPALNSATTNLGAWAKHAIAKAIGPYFGS